MKRMKERAGTPRLFNVIEDLKDGFCTIDLEGNFIYLNLAAKEMLKQNGEYGRNFFQDVVKEKTNVENLKIYLQCNTYIKDFELNLYITDEQKFPSIISINQIKDPSNKVVGMSILIKDMTYIKQVQQQLLQAQKMESIGMLASGVAHEFNNILTGIIPNADLIKITTNSGDPNYGRADAIQKSANRASEIVKKLLNFARTENLVKSESTDFTRVVKDTIEILKRLFDRNIELIYEFAHDLFFVKIDETSIQQIIMNLSINAKDAIVGRGTISFKASNYVIDSLEGTNTSKLSVGKYVKFEITDTGQGIEKVHIENIFDPFYTTKAPGKGTGLGLSMVYGIVNSCKGKISVKSQLNIGTTFTIYIPATKKAEQREVSEFITHNIGNDKTILVVDDEEIIAEMAADMLQSIGFFVITASNGIEALDIYKEKMNQIDLVLLDLIMPEMDGSTCFNNLKLLNPNIKVIISSGIDAHKNKTELIKLGVKGYLEKPYSLKKISKTLEKVMSEF
jgi:two-component system, cell cycle sensor histidine kinase and response regulator CckA